MELIVLDLEWNTVSLPDGSTFQEIIQIGAVRMNRDYTPGERFQALVHNSSGPLSEHIARLVHLSDKKLAKADPFPAVWERFFCWCAERPRFCTWSNSDLPVLRENLHHWGIDVPLRRAYNVQFAYTLLEHSSASALSLGKAVEQCSLTRDEPFHSALNDAVYTAEIFALLYQRHGKHMEERSLYARLRRLKARKRQGQPLAPPATLEQFLAAPGRYSRSRHHRRLSTHYRKQTYLRSKRLRAFRCPRCKALFTGTPWRRMGKNAYLSSFSCPRHGAYFALMALKPKPPDAWEGILDLFTPEDAPLLSQWAAEHPMEPKN